jgi:hypothetical protein
VRGRGRHRSRPGPGLPGQVPQLTATHQNERGRSRPLGRRPVLPRLRRQVANVTTSDHGRAQRNVATITNTTDAARTRLEHAGAITLHGTSENKTAHEAPAQADRSPGPTLEPVLVRPSERACGCGPETEPGRRHRRTQARARGEVAEHPNRPPETTPFPPPHPRCPPIRDGRSKRAAGRAPPHRSSSGTNPRAPHASRAGPGSDAHGSR